ncbi:hypothetical protein BGW80DRAFT_1268256 [Lactifluus volemus]|nr:hypothetical protein BGW80DRAFT_1268256 [Lactifluus volemus]
MPNLPSINNSHTLILGFDGLEHIEFPYLSNVQKLVGLFNIPSDLQVVYVQPTYGKFNEWRANAGSRLYAMITNKLDKIFDLYIAYHILEAYKFLVRNYHPGDQIFFFGFARGAYVARALAGMLCKVGLLLKCHISHLPRGYDLYCDESQYALKPARLFKAAYCKKETLPSIGYNIRQPFLFSIGHETIQVFRQALSLDDKRAMQHMAGALQTNVKEVWFVGNHTDIGGGSMPYDSDYALSNISLRWMIREIVGQGHHKLFRTNLHPVEQRLYPIPPPSQQNPLDLNDLRQGVENTNSGHGRVMPTNPLFHNSVQTYMTNNPLYQPKAVYVHGTENYVS